LSTGSALEEFIRSGSTCCALLEAKASWCDPSSAPLADAIGLSKFYQQLRQLTTYI
jgi:hypothetical protein